MPDPELGELCGACFQVFGKCKCVSLELGGDVDWPVRSTEATTSGSPNGSPLSAEEVMFFLPRGQQGMIQEDLFEPYIWDEEECTCR